MNTNELERLSSLRERGLLSDEEFAHAKSRLLYSPTTPEPAPSRVPMLVVLVVVAAVVGTGYLLYPTAITFLQSGRTGARQTASVAQQLAPAPVRTTPVPAAPPQRPAITANDLVSDINGQSVRMDGSQGSNTWTFEPGEMKQVQVSENTGNHLQRRLSFTFATQSRPNASPRYTVNGYAEAFYEWHADRWTLVGLENVSAGYECHGWLC